MVFPNDAQEGMELIVGPLLSAPCCWCTHLPCPGRAQAASLTPGPEPRPGPGPRGLSCRLGLTGGPTEKRCLLRLPQQQSEMAARGAWWPGACHHTEGPSVQSQSCPMSAGMALLWTPRQGSLCLCPLLLQLQTPPPPPNQTSAFKGALGLSLTPSAGKLRPREGEALASGLHGTLHLAQNPRAPVLSPDMCLIGSCPVSEAAQPSTCLGSDTYWASHLAALCLSLPT